MDQTLIQHEQDEALQKNFGKRRMWLSDNFLERRHHIEPERRRWIILLGYSILTYKWPTQYILSSNTYISFANLMPWSTYSLIIDSTEAYYGIGETAYLQFFNVFIYGLLISLIPVAVYFTSSFLNHCENSFHTSWQSILLRVWWFHQ